MRMRLGVPLLAFAGLLGAVQTAAAANCGAANYGCTQQCGDAQTCFSAQQQHFVTKQVQFVIKMSVIVHKSISKKSADYADYTDF